MASIIHQVKLWGARQSQHALRSAAMFLPVLLLIGTPVIGLSVVILQLSNLMPKPNTFTLQTLVGVTILFSAVIVSVLTSAHIWALWLGYRGLDFIGLDYGVKKLFIGILWGTGLQVFAFLTLVTLSWLRIDKVSFSSLAVINVLIITVSSLNTGFIEEVLFRGVLYSALRPFWGWWITAIATSALFVFPHFIFNSYDFPISAALGLLTGGLLFAWVREITKGLWIPIGIHFAWDAAIGWFNLTASKSPHLLMTTFDAPRWVTDDWGVNDWILLFVFAASLWTFKSKAKGAG
jgi:membrane protease YdiL (CAAX protease family)